MDANTLGYTQINNYITDSNNKYYVSDCLIVFNESLITSLKNQIRNGGKSSFYYMFLHEIGHGLGIVHYLMQIFYKLV